MQALRTLPAALAATSMIFVLSACADANKDTATSPSTSTSLDNQQPAAPQRPGEPATTTKPGGGTTACGTITDSYTGDPLTVLATNTTCAEATAVISEFNSRYIDDEAALAKVDRTVTYQGRTWTCDFAGDDACTAPGGMKVSTQSRPAPADIGQIDLDAALLADPAVGQMTKKAMRACCELGTDYQDFTGDGVVDVLVDVPSGGSSGTRAAYVYTLRDGRLSQIFKAEPGQGRGGDVVGLKDNERKFHLRADKGDVLVSRAVYGPQDANCCPSSQRLSRYHWDGTRFIQQGPDWSAAR